MQFLAEQSPSQPLRRFTSLISIFCVDVTTGCFFGYTFISHHTQHISSPRLAWFFLLVFHGIPTDFLPQQKILKTSHRVKSVRIQSYSRRYFPAIRLRENTDQNNSQYGYILRSESVDYRLRRIQKPVKHLKWIALRKWLEAFIR